MRIVFRAHPELGHLYPLMPLAEAARAAGHEVVFPTTAPFVDRLGVLGFDVVEAGISLGDARRRSSGARPLVVDDAGTDWQGIGEFFAIAALAAAHDLARLIPALDADLVVHDHTDLGAGAAAAALGLPSVAVAVARSFTPAIHDAMFGPSIEVLQERFGTAPPADRPVIDTYPPSVQRLGFLDDPRRVPMRAVPWSEPWPAVPGADPRPGRRMVFATLGSVTDSVEHLQRVVDGLATVDADIVVATGIADPDGLVRVPANVHVAGLVRLAAVLPHLDAMVHHGGCGTTTAAWAHAVPQVVLPDGADRFVNAAAVVASGAGVALDAPTPDEVPTSVRAVLDDPSFARAAQAVRAEIDAMPDPTRVLAAITDVRARVRS